MNSAGERVLILGLAREGESLARFLARRGARVTVTDSAAPARLQERALRLAAEPVELVLGGHHPGLVAETDRFFVSPGVPRSSPVYVAAREAGLRVESMTTLFFELCPGKIVGVTGSSGKTTTASLIAHILRQAGKDVLIGGNIGDPMIDLLPRTRPTTIVVLELSSFQLEILDRSPQVAVITNISPNHLDRHSSMAEYVGAKRRIVEHQTPGDTAVLNADDPEVATFAGATRASVHWFGLQTARIPGATLLASELGLAHPDSFEPVMPAADIPLLGRHNIENVLAAFATASALGVHPTEMAAAVRSFRPPPHRLELVGERDGVRYVDDSIATSPSRAVVALRAIDRPILLIAGGRDKRLPWEDFAAVAAQRVRALFLIGEAAPDIERIVLHRLETEEESRLRPADIMRCASLPEAVTEARERAVPGDVVLLSPGCASYDMFADFEERGAVFARAVEAVYAA